MVYNIVIFGAGSESYKRVPLMPKNWQIIAFVDNDKNKWGLKWNGKIEIDSPNMLDELKYDYIVVMTQNFKKEIFKELLNKGISPMRIIDGCKENNSEDLEDYFKMVAKDRDNYINSKYIFEDRSSNQRKMLYVLAGYKEWIWEDTLSRLKKFVPLDVDVCITSSGVYCSKLSKICERNGWSYFSTEINNLTFLQNTVIALHPKAELIYKMDEDIYITANCIEKMEKTYLDAEKKADFHVGFVGPIIPLHTSGRIFLQEFKLEEKCKETIGKENIIWGGRIGNPKYAIDEDIPLFLWSQGNIDELNRCAENRGDRFLLSPIWYAICFILFSRSLWEDMWGFQFSKKGNRYYGAGPDGDEGQLMRFCYEEARVIIVALNTVCGHFAYTLQEERMREFREENRQFFDILS